MSEANLLRSRSIPTFSAIPVMGMTFLECDHSHIQPFLDASDSKHISRSPLLLCYIMGSISGTLYIGFSGNLHKRVFQHKFHHFEGFTERYEATRLLYWESYDDVHKAMARETQLKGWSRAKKVALIVRRNSHWVDLAAD